MKQKGTLVHKARIRCGKTRQQCAEEMAKLAGLDPKKASYGRWGDLERDENLETREYVTVFHMALVLDTSTWMLVPRAKRRAALDRRKHLARLRREFPGKSKA